MRVVKAKVLGFCMGVRRAVDLALREAARGGGAAPARVYTMGPLVHNPRVMETLRKAGVEILDEDALPRDLRGAAMIIRAHGIPPALEAELIRREARLVDATCPRVKANQLKARTLGAGGYAVFLAGEKDHEEIAGIRGYIEGGGPCFVAAGPEEAASRAEELLRRDPAARTALIGQTTISGEEYAGIAAAIRRFFPDLEVIDSICGATRDRQEALRELCPRVDAVIVAGGRSSANTRRLLSIARSLGKEAWLIEGAAELPPGLGRHGLIGLSAGASTPDETVDEIEKGIHSILGEKSGFAGNPAEAGKIRPREDQTPFPGHGY